MARYELPPDLSPEERDAAVDALERYFRTATARPSPWALAGRTEGLGLGALQIRFQSLKRWGEIRLNPYTRRGADTRMGRGDSK
jgi:hypothetical protein